LSYVKDKKNFFCPGFSLKNAYFIINGANPVKIHLKLKAKFDCDMDNYLNRNEGIKLLIRKYRKEFRRKENTNFYTDEDYKAAERKFVKYCLLNRTRT
jgi:hypothetical protein